MSDGAQEKAPWGVIGTGIGLVLLVVFAVLYILSGLFGVLMGRAARGD